MNVGTSVPAALVLLLACSLARADLARDAAKAAPKEGGELILETAIQVERDGGDRTLALESALQYTPEFFPRLSLLLEPVLREWSLPGDGAPTVMGLGDTEFSLNMLLLPARGIRPALLLGGKVKLPTAASPDLGTGESDFSALLVIGNEFDDLDLNLELEYVSVGLEDPPPAEEGGGAGGGAAEAEEAERWEILHDVWTYTLALDLSLGENLSLFLESFGNTRLSNLEGGSQALAAGFELDVDLWDRLNLFVQGGLDTNGLFAPKAGFELVW